MGFFARAPSRNGHAPGQALAPRKRPLPEIGFFAGAPAGNGLLASILQFPAFWAFISLHFGRVGLHFLSFFGLVGLYFLAFWPCGPSFPFISGQALALCKRPLPEIGFFACAPARKGLLAGQALALRRRPLPEKRFFAGAPSRNGRVPGQALAPRKRPLPERRFFVGASAGSGLLAGQALALCKRPLPEMGFFACPNIGFLLAPLWTALVAG